MIESLELIDFTVYDVLMTIHDLKRIFGQDMLY